MSPFQLMRHFSDEMDRMWSGGFGGERHGGDITNWRPAVDVREHNGNLQVHAELPGLSENDVKVSVENDMLVIQGERRRNQEREHEGWYRVERSYGSFYRAIPLPEGAEPDKANARFNNGVLEIEMPLSRMQQSARQIPIHTGSGQTAQMSHSGSSGQSTHSPASTSSTSSSGTGETSSPGTGQSSSTGTAQTPQAQTGSTTQPPGERSGRAGGS